MRMAGSSPDLQTAVAGSLAALGYSVPGLYSTIDWFTGDTNGVNSGEIPLNVLINMLPMLTTSAGFAAGATTAPGFLSLVDRHALDDRLEQTLDQLKDLNDLQRTKGTQPTPRMKQDIADLGQKMKAEYDVANAAVMDKARAIAARQNASSPASEQEAVDLIHRIAGRRGAYGALAGAIAGGVPAVMMMRDQEQPQRS